MQCELKSVNLYFVGNIIWQMAGGWLRGGTGRAGGVGEEEEEGGDFNFYFFILYKFVNL